MLSDLKHCDNFGKQNKYDTANIQANYNSVKGHIYINGQDSVMDCVKRFANNETDSRSLIYRLSVKDLNHKDIAYGIRNLTYFCADQNVDCIV